jgi:RNA polymerase sigma-70 factor (ECF subfamily)
MSERVPIDPERLLAQTAWVRRLARSLARDDASADDLVQDTFVAALRRPPAGAQHEARLRAWFGFVLRNMAIRRTRSESRRVERERRSADGGRSGSDERAEELEELRAELYQHVKALPEASREVVLLRFFEELDSAEIARRLGVPDSTVRNRLRRALAELRERLEREHGSDWRNLCLFVLPSTGAKVAAGTGAVAAAAGGLWIAGGAVVVVALALVLWIGSRGAGQQTESETLAAVPVEIPLSAQANDTQSTGGRLPSSPTGSDSTRMPEGGALRVVVSDSYEPPPTSPFAHGIIVYGVVRDETGEPIDGALLRWTDSWGRTVCPGTSEGKYSANSFAPGLQVVRLFGHACGEAFHEVTLAADKELQSFDFTVRRTRVVPVYVLDPEGNNLLEAGAVCDPRTRGCAVAVVTRMPPPAKMRLSIGTDEYHPEWTAMLQGWERREPTPTGALGLVEMDGGSPCFVSLLHLGTVLAIQRFESVPERVTFQVERSRFEHVRADRASSSRSWVLTPDGFTEILQPGQKAPPLPIGAPVHLQFLDGAARPVMANFEFSWDQSGVNETIASSGGRSYLGSPFGAAAHANGTFDWDGLQPGRYVLQITGTRDDGDPTFTRVGALPRRVELAGGNETTEIVVHMSPLREVLLRSRCAADEWFRWEITTCDGLPVTQGILIGHAPRSFGLPPGRFVVKVRAQQDDAVLAAEQFEIDEQPLVLELMR